MPSSSEILQFGPFELNRKTGELRKQGIRVRLQPKPLQVLYTLLETPGAVVSRDEMKARLWPEDTFVDFESGVNTAVNRLRLALGDSAENPRYIETASRVGYRFIAPVSAMPATAAPAPALEPRAAPPSAARVPLRLAVGIALVAALALSAAIRFRTPGAQVRFAQVTFRRGQVGGARFTPGNATIIYAARWDSEPRRLYEVGTGNPASHVLGFEGYTLLDISRSGELLLSRSGGTANITGGSLFRVSRNGGPFQHLADNVFGADWAPDGARIAIVRVIDGAQQLEFPIGSILYRTSGWLANIRVSPDGRAVAFIDHPMRHEEAGAVRMVDTTGAVRTLAGDWATAVGMDWRGANELWFTAAKEKGSPSVWAVTLNGALRPIGHAPGILTLRDISSDGRALLTLESRRLLIAGALAGDQHERDFSLTDWSRVQQLSSDGSLLLFDESGEGAGWRPFAYLRRTRAGDTIRLRDGLAQGFTSDGQAAIVLSEDRKRLFRVPLSGGAGDDLPTAGLTYQWARPFPDGARLLALASSKVEPLRLYILDLRTGRAAPLTGPMMVRNAAVSPDGRSVAVLRPSGTLAIYPIDGGAPREIPSESPLAPIRWSVDGRWLFVAHLRASVQSSADVSRIDTDTGERRLWKTLAPADSIGVNSITGVTIADDERSYAYSYRRVLSELYVAEGWR